MSDPSSSVARPAKIPLSTIEFVLENHLNRWSGTLIKIKQKLHKKLLKNNTENSHYFSQCQTIWENSQNNFTNCWHFSSQNKLNKRLTVTVLVLFTLSFFYFPLSFLHGGQSRCEAAAMILKFSIYFKRFFEILFPLLRCCCFSCQSTNVLTPASVPPFIALQWVWAENSNGISEWNGNKRKLCARMRKIPTALLRSSSFFPSLRIFGHVLQWTVFWPITSERRDDNNIAWFLHNQVEPRVVNFADALSQLIVPL